MAGPGGFEPPNAGIKTRCLNRLATAHPLPGDPIDRPFLNLSTSRPARGVRAALTAAPVPQPAKSYSGEAFLPLTTYPVMPLGRRSASSRATASVSQAVNTQLPVPLIRAR